MPAAESVSIVAGGEEALRIEYPPLGLPYARNASGVLTGSRVYCSVRGMKASPLFAFMGITSCSAPAS